MKSQYHTNKWIKKEEAEDTSTRTMTLSRHLGTDKDNNKPTKVYDEILKTKTLKFRQLHRYNWYPIRETLLLESK